MPKAKSKKRTGVTVLVHKGHRLMLTDAEYNRAWKRAKKYSGLD